MSDGIKIGLIGGSGLGAALAQSTEGARHEVETPFGKPSECEDAVGVGFAALLTTG